MYRNVKDMKIDSNKLLDDLKSQTVSIIDQVTSMRLQGIQRLNAKLNEESWSALECIEHLNRYGRFYIPEINNRLQLADKSDKSTFSSGWLGNYFAKIMIPSTNMKPMKTFTSMNPNGSQLDVSVLDEFLTQQRQILKILENAREVDLSKTKTSISISKLIKLRLGDTLRVVIYHNERHILQAQRAVS